MENYRIRAYTPAGLTVFQMGFQQSKDMENYWNELFKPGGLDAFGKIGYIILSREHLTEGGNWEAEMVTPAEVTVQ